MSTLSRDKVNLLAYRAAKSGYWAGTPASHMQTFRAKGTDTWKLGSHAPGPRVPLVPAASTSRGGILFCPMAPSRHSIDAPACSCSICSTSTLQHVRTHARSATWIPFDGVAVVTIRTPASPRRAERGLGLDVGLGGGHRKATGAPRRSMAHLAAHDDGRADLAAPIPPTVPKEVSPSAHRFRPPRIANKPSCRFRPRLFHGKSVRDQGPPRIALFAGVRG
jgi:hypothetical protein